jgi:hypothetical protein
VSPWPSGLNKKLNKKTSGKAGGKQIRRETASIVGARIYGKSVVSI